jgi:hypothetical protein
MFEIVAQQQTTKLFQNQKTTGSMPEFSTAVSTSFPRSKLVFL